MMVLILKDGRFIPVTVNQLNASFKKNKEAGSFAALCSPVHVDFIVNK